MPSRTRNSRATMPTTSVLPPCELAMTILRKPARCTPSPTSNQLRMRLSAEWVMVPLERRCSLDFPIVWVGRNSTRRSSGRRASTTAVRSRLHGTPCSEDGAPPSMTVLDWLRTRAQLTGTKEGCAEGDCGACTIVLGRRVDGSLQFRAVNSCLMMLPQIDNCAVLKGEGVAAGDGPLHTGRLALGESGSH